ncbi:MAG: hypothetical protein AAB263_16145 [Planctomycetota bacterium]
MKRLLVVICFALIGYVVAYLIWIDHISIGSTGFFGKKYIPVGSSELLPAPAQFFGPLIYLDWKIGRLVIGGGVKDT